MPFAETNSIAMLAENVSWQKGAFAAGAGLLGWIAYVCLKQGFMAAKTRRIPSCSGFLPVIGHSFELLRDNVWKVFASMGASHGPVCKLFVMGQLYIVVSSPEAVKHVLMNPAIYHKDKGTYGFFKSLLGTGIVTAEGEHHQRLRRLVSHIMKNNILGDAAAYSHAATERLLRALDAHAQSDAASQPVEIGEMLRLLTLQVIGTAVLGLDPEESNRELPQLYLPIIEECNDRVWFPPRMFFPTKSNIMFGRHVSQLNAFVVKQIRKRQDERSKPAFDKKAPPRDILDRFFEGYDDKFDEKTVLQLRDDLKTFLFAGHDTSATLLTWAVWELSQHPQMFDRVRLEADNVWGQWRGGAVEHALRQQAPLQVPDYEKLDNQLNFTLCVLKETLRKYTVVPSVTRDPQQSDTITTTDAKTGVKTLFSIPKGARVVVNIYGVHQNPELWPEPLKFNPDRSASIFAEEEQKFHFLPFLTGPRSCLGQWLATLEGRVVLCLLCRYFDFEAAQGMDESQHRYRIPVAPEKGMWLNVKHRA